MGLGIVGDSLKGKPKPPKTPDYTGAAIASANANKYNTVGPYGSGTWTLRPGANPNNPQAGDTTMTTTLNPGEQALYDQGVLNRQGVAGATRGMLADLGDRKAVADALYGRATQYLGQQFGDQERELETRLVNQGLMRGSEAFDNAMRNFMQTRNQAFEGAASSAVINADTAQNNAVQRIAQMLAMGREITPQTAGMGGGADLLGAVGQQYQGDLGRWNAQQAQKDQQQQQLMQIAGTAAMFFSDRRLKSNINLVGVKSGLPVYEYDIEGRRERGYMADEVELVRPEAVHKHPSGYLMVDYGALGGRP
jgi:hypothetical protein